MSDFSDPDDEVTEIRRVMVNYLGKLQQRTPNMTFVERSKGSQENDA